MSSSSASTGAIIKAPMGWTSEEIYMYRNYYWAGKAGDIKHMLETDYGLQGVNPRWTRKSEYGDVLFLFEATLKGGLNATLRYYVWNGIENSICYITKMDGKLEEIGRAIEKGNGGLGAYLTLQVVEP